MSKVTVYVGLDYHKDSIQVCTMDAAGKVLVNRSCRNDAWPWRGSWRRRQTMSAARSISVSCEPGVLCPSPQKGSIQNPDAVFAMIHRRLTNPPLGMHWTAHGRQPVCSCCKCVKFFDMRLDAGFPPDSPSQNIGAKRIHFAT